MRNKALALFFGVLALSILACRTGSPDRQLNLYPSPTGEATQTPLVREITTTPFPSQTPLVVVYTTTPVPTKAEDYWLCVTASEAVYLRPSPSIENYPIIQLENGEKVSDLRSRDGSWIFVQVRDKRGWVRVEYVGECK